MIARGANLARARKAPHKQLVGAIIEPVQRNRPRRQRGCIKRNTASERTQRGIPQHGLTHARQAPALHQQPRIELRPGAGIDPLQQLATNERGIRIARSERQYVHDSPRRQPQLQWIPVQRAGYPKRATQLRQRPPQRPAWIIGITEDQPRQPRARHRSLRQDHVRQHSPRLMATRRRDHHAVALDLRRSQQTDHEPRHDITIVNRHASTGRRQRIIRTTSGQAPPALAPPVHAPDRRRPSLAGLPLRRRSGRLRRPSAHGCSGRAARAPGADVREHLLSPGRKQACHAWAAGARAGRPTREPASGCGRRPHSPGSVSCGCSSGRSACRSAGSVIAVLLGRNYWHA